MRPEKNTTSDPLSTKKNKTAYTNTGMQTHPCTLDASAFSSVTLSMAQCPLDHWVKPNPSQQTPTAQARLARNSLTSKRERDILAGASPQGGCRAAGMRLQLQQVRNDSQLTEHKPVTGELPSGVVGKLHGIHIDVLVAVWAHRLYDPPADLIPRFLEDKTWMRANQLFLSSWAWGLLDLLLGLIIGFWDSFPIWSCF